MGVLAALPDGELWREVSGVIERHEREAITRSTAMPGATQFLDDLDDLDLDDLDHLGERPWAGSPSAASMRGSRVRRDPPSRPGLRVPGQVLDALPADQTSPEGARATCRGPGRTRSAGMTAQESASS
jgi:hypothetical protein